MEQIISLNKAFKVRNLLKQKLNEAETLYAHAPKTIEVGKQEKYLSTNGIETKVIVHQMAYVQEILSKFNCCIEHFNVQAGAIICALNQKRDVLKMLRRLVTDLQYATYESTKTNPVTGETIVTQYEAYEDVKIFVQMEQEISAEILALEDDLGRANAEVIVDVGEDLLKEIQNIIPGI